MIRIGPAGWAYADWTGIMYPKPMPRGVHRLRWVARWFDVVEINSTFYRPAAPYIATTWLTHVADAPDFRFTAKLWQRFTHERTEAWTRAEVKEASGALDVLHDAGRLGAVLVQFPWSFRRTDENRAWLSDVLSAFARFPLVLEVRHESWNVPSFYAALADRGVGFVNIDQPLFKRSIKPSATVTSGVGYVRVHGRNYNNWFRKDAGVEARYDYLYSPAELEPWAARAKTIDADARETYVVTNNHFHAQAVVNAAQLESMISGTKVEVPATLMQHYPNELQDYATAS